MMIFFLEMIGFFLASLGARGRLWLSWALAILVFDILRVRRKLVMQNLSRAFGSDTKESVRAHVARAATANFILTSLEFFCARWIFPAQQLDLKNSDRLQALVDRKQGVYVMVIHSGNFELMAYGVSQRFGQLYAPVKPVGKGQMALWVKRKRAAHGLEEIANDGLSSRSRTARIMDGLKRSEIIGFMVDQRRARGILVPFFGELAWTNSGLFYLWKQKQAPIIPITIRRVGLNHHEIEFHEEFIPETRENWSSDEFILENTKRMNRYVEALILANPKEYFWMHDRWKK